MNRIRIGCAITTLLGAMYAAAGLLQSLGHFALGLIVAAVGVIGYGLVDVIESDRQEKLRQYRAEVWHRRDLQARQEVRGYNLYEHPRDGRGDEVA